MERDTLVLIGYQVDEAIGFTNGLYEMKNQERYRCQISLASCFKTFLSCVKITSVGLKLDRPHCTIGYCYNTLLRLIERFTSNVRIFPCFNLVHLHAPIT